MTDQLRKFLIYAGRQCGKTQTTNLIIKKYMEEYLKNTHTICSKCGAEGLTGVFNLNHLCDFCYKQQYVGHNPLALENLKEIKYVEKKEEIRKFESGAVRGSGGKFDFPEYLSAYLIFRFGEHMRKNAVKYGAGNWKKRNSDGTTGIPKDEYFKSLVRHFFMLYMQETEGVVMEPETDHLAGLIFNIQGLIVHEEESKFKNKDEMYGYPVIPSEPGGNKKLDK